MEISQETFDFLASCVFITALVGLLTVAPLWPILTFLTPKKMLENYFREPYFQRNEIDLMSSFPISLLRTSIFGWMTLIPSLDTKRGIRGCHKFMPKWYKCLISLWCLIGLLTFIITVPGLIFLSNVTITN